MCAYCHSNNICQLSANNKRRKDIYRLPRADTELIREIKYREKLEFVDRAILENAHFLLRIVENPDMFGHDVDLADLESDDEKKGNDEKGKGGQTQAGLHSHGHASGMLHRYSANV